MRALRFAETLRARYGRAGVLVRFVALVARPLPSRGVAVCGAMVFLRARRPFAANALPPGALGAAARQPSIVREAWREILRRESHTIIVTRPPAVEGSRAASVAALHAPHSAPSAWSPPPRPAPAGRGGRRPAAPRPAVVAGVRSLVVRTALRASLAGGNASALLPPARLDAVSARPPAPGASGRRLRAYASTSSRVERTILASRSTPPTPSARVSAAAAPAASATVFVTAFLPAPTLPPRDAPVAAAFWASAGVVARGRPPLASGRSLVTERSRASAFRAEGSAPTMPAAQGLRRGPVRWLAGAARAGQTTPRLEPPRGVAGALALRPAALPGVGWPPRTGLDMAVASPWASAAAPAAPGLEYLRLKPPAAAPARLEETLRRQVEEKVERKIVERVDAAVARQLAPDSVYSRSLGELLCARIYDGLVLERERMGGR